MGSLIHLNALALWLSLSVLLWTAPLCAAPTTGMVSWIYDGDTLMVDGIGKVRLIGIDTPEREGSARDHYYSQRHQIPPARLRKIAKAALDFNVRNVKGLQVLLEFDEQKKDKFGRTLAYVYLPEGDLLNLLLLKNGLATVYRRFDFRLKQKFLAAEKSARKAKVGIWKQ